MHRTHQVTFRHPPMSRQALLRMSTRTLDDNRKSVHSTGPGLLSFPAKLGPEGWACPPTLTMSATRHANAKLFSVFLVVAASLRRVRAEAVLVDFVNYWDIHDRGSEYFGRMAGRAVYGKTVLNPRQPIFVLVGTSLRGCSLLKYLHGAKTRIFDPLLVEGSLAC